MLFLTSPSSLFKRNSTLLPGPGVIVWDRLKSSVNILFTTKPLSPNPLSWDMDCLLILWPSLSLGNSYCTFGFLIFIIDQRNFLYYRLYILKEKSLKHLCSIRDWVPVSFFLSISLSPADSLEHRDLSCSLSCPGFWDSLKKAPYAFTPPREGAWCLCERCKSCVKDFIGFLRKPGSISLFLSFTFLSLPPDHQVPVH